MKKHIGRAELRPVLLGEVHEGEDVGLGFIEQGCALWQAGAQLIGDMAVCFAGSGRRALSEGGGDEGRDDATADLVIARGDFARQVLSQFSVDLPASAAQSDRLAASLPDKSASNGSQRTSS